MNYCKLVANDIINYALEKTDTRSYKMSFIEYVDEFDDRTRKSILNNLNNILDCLEKNHDITSLKYDSEKCIIDFIFDEDILLNHTEKVVKVIANNTDEIIQLEELRKITKDVLTDNYFIEAVDGKIKDHQKEKGLER